MNAPVYSGQDLQDLLIFAGAMFLGITLGSVVYALTLGRRKDNGPCRVVADTNARTEKGAAEQAFRDDATAAFEQVLHGSPTLAAVRAEHAAREAESLDEEWAQLDQAVNGGEA